MSRSFKTNPARPTFGVFNESQDASCYTLNKKLKTIFCKTNLCFSNNIVSNESDLMLLKRANKLVNFKEKNNYNNTNLYNNLNTKLVLTDVSVIQENKPPFSSPTPINEYLVPYLSYIIDPNGQLFGNTLCGANNYLNYLVYNLPKNTY
jgi:hypothetical protein